MKININQLVRVTLTNEGKAIYGQHYRQYGQYPIPPDVLETELWDIMNIFGKYLHNGCKMPFDAYLEVL